jgi:hypothetical protein
MTNKTLFDAVEAELRNARAALSNAGGYLDMLEDAMEAMIKTENGEYMLPVAVDGDDASIVFGLRATSVNEEIEAYLRLF